MHIQCLSFHAAYRCHHSGECCRADWDITVEPLILEAVRSGRIVPARSTQAPFARADGTSVMVLARTDAGDCGFHGNRRCSLQEAGGEPMLPSACRHFPRVFLRDRRGYLLTLSHFCPTAAGMLFDDVPVTVVKAQPPLALDEPIEGLDARDALPPLLRPGMLADIEGYSAWEAAVVRTLGGSSDTNRALASIEQATERVRTWEPGGRSLSQAVGEAFDSRTHPPERPGLSSGFSILRELTGPHPLMEVGSGFVAQWQRIRPDAGDPLLRTIGRYLAATAFGNWIAYRGQGLRSIVAWIRGCHDVLRVQLVRGLGDGRGRIDRDLLLQSIRMTDYVMVHTVDSLAFGRAAVVLER